MNEGYAEEFDWGCGYPNGFYDLVDWNHPTPYTLSREKTSYGWAEDWTNAVETSPKGYTETGSFRNSYSNSNAHDWNKGQITYFVSNTASYSNEYKYTTTTRTVETNPLEWGIQYTESRVNIYLTTTNGSFTYSSATVQNSTSTTTEATETGLVETHSSTTVEHSHWAFTRCPKMVTTITGIATVGTRSSTVLYSSSSSLYHTFSYIDPENWDNTLTRTNSESGGFSTIHGESYTFIGDFGGFADKGSYTPMRATYSIGLLSGETFYYITNSAGDWGSPESLVGPNSTSFSFTYKRFDGRLGQNVIGKRYGKEVPIKFFNESELGNTDLASSCTTVFQEKILTDTVVSIDAYGTTGKMFNIWGQKWQPCIYTNTYTFKLDSSEFGLPYDFTEAKVYNAYGTVIGQYTRKINGSGRTIDSTTYELSGAIKSYNYGRSPILALSKWGVWGLGSAQNGYISPLTSSFHTADPEFSSWSKTGTDAGTLSIGLANNFVKAEVPKLYKSNSSTSTTYTFSVIGAGDGSAADSGVWYLGMFSEACMEGVRLNPFSKDYRIGLIFNGAHSQREYVIHGNAANEQKLVLKEKVSSGYANADTKFTFAYSKGEGNITTITVPSEKVYEVFVEYPALSDVLGPDSPVRVIVAVQAQYLAHNFVNAKNWQAAKWMHAYSPPDSSTADWAHYIEVYRPWEWQTSGGGGGGYL